VPMVPAIFFIELFSFLIRPFSLALRLFVAMMAGHVLLKVLSSFVIDGLNYGASTSLIVAIPGALLVLFLYYRYFAEKWNLKI